LATEAAVTNQKLIVVKKGVIQYVSSIVDFKINELST